MNDHVSSDQLRDDLSWVRQQLGAANPVPAADERTAIYPGVAALAGVGISQDDQPLAASRVRSHRGAKVATALIGAAAMIAGIVAAGVMSSGGSSHGVTRLASTQPVFAAAATTEAAHTAQVSLSVIAGTAAATIQGLADLTAGNAEFTADLPAGLGVAQIRIVGPVAYVELPSNVQPLLGGKPWVKTDLATVEGLAGQQLGIPVFGGGLDFTGVLDWLRGVSGPVTTDGTTTTIHGDATTHYHADVDLTKAAANAPASSRARVEQAAQAAGQIVPVDVWIDNQGRLRRLIASFDPSRIQAPAGVTIKSPGTVTATLELWNFGTPVNVTAPTTDQVSPLSGIGDALKGFIGGAGPSGSKRSETTSTTLAG